MSGGATNLRDALRRGGATLAAGALASRLLQALAYALLARLLVPADFGALALASVAINALTLLPGLGLGTALLARSRDPRPIARSALTAAIGGGLLLAAIAAAIGAAMRARGETTVGTLVIVLGGALCFQAPGTVAGALLDRELRFGWRIAADLAGGVAFLVVGVAAARAGLGACALALALVASAAAQSLAALRGARLAPTLAPSWSELRTTARLGALVLATSLLQWLFVSLDVACVEQRFGRDAVGCYATAAQLALVPATAAGLLSGRLALPALVRAREAGRDATRGFLDAARAAALLAAATCATFAVAAKPLVALLWGDRFAASAPLLPLLALGSAARIVGGLAGPALLATGRARVALALVALQLALALPVALLAPAALGAGGVALAFSLANVVGAALACAVVARALALPDGAALRALLLPPLVVLLPALLLARVAPGVGGWIGLACGVALAVPLARPCWRALRPAGAAA